ncbi:hypothetical protein L6452_15688 [Arctium lappa]|uniref:Uncharacterized protein n=1 Tax=Arctium lappa TaxID=4217 RepID=A0ACB9CPA7_ARCLA|nr:hypothetical protein L6452_15688 [Arctium lappa]
MHNKMYVDLDLANQDKVNKHQTLHNPNLKISHTERPLPPTLAPPPHLHHLRRATALHNLILPDPFPAKMQQICSRRFFKA